MVLTRAAIYRRLGLELAVTVVVAVAGWFLLAYVYHLAATGQYPWLSTTVLAALDAGVIVLVAYLFGHAITSATRDRMISAGYPQNSARVRLVIWALIVVAALLAIIGLPGGEQLTSVLFGATIIGLVLGLALQPVLSNAFAGMVIVLSAPFHVGDRISLILPSPGIAGGVYPREYSYPSYSGVVEDVGVIYTELRLDSGEVTRLPNAIVLVSPAVTVPRPAVHQLRIRISFPAAVEVKAVEALLPEAQALTHAEPPEGSKPQLLVADITMSTWDAAIVVWARDGQEVPARDQVLRLVRERLPELGGSRPPSAK